MLKSALFGLAFGLVIFVVGFFASKLSSALFYGVTTGALFAVSVYLHDVNKERKAAANKAEPAPGDNGGAGGGKE